MLELLYTVFKRFSKAGKLRVLSLVFSQMVLSLLDIVGLLLLGAVSALSVSRFDKSATPHLVTKLLEFFSLINLSFIRQISILLGIIALFFLAKTLISILILRRIYAVLAEQDVFFGRSQTLALFKKPYSYLRNFNSQDLLFCLSGAVEQTIFGVVGSGITLVTELSFITLLFLSFGFANLELTFFTICYFLLVGYIFHKHSQEKIHKLSTDANVLSLALNSSILESVGLLRELHLRNDYEYIIGRVDTSRIKLAAARAELSLWPNISKYYVEVTFVVALFLVTAISLMLTDIKSAIPSLAVFIVGSSRAIPSLLRIQNALIAIKQNEPGARFTLAVTSDEANTTQSKTEPAGSLDATFVGSVSLRDICFSYNESNPILDRANLEIEAGEFVSIIGKSGEVNQHSWI